MGFDIRFAAVATHGIRLRIDKTSYVGFDTHSLGQVSVYGTGAPDAERVIVLMGSGIETTHQTVEYLLGKGEKVGMVRARIYRPFSVEPFIKALPATTRGWASSTRAS